MSTEIASGPVLPALPEISGALAEHLQAALAQLRAAGVDIDTLRGDEALRGTLDALCIASNWAVDYLAARPPLLAQLVQQGLHKQAPSRAQLVAELTDLMAQVPPSADDEKPAGTLGKALREFRYKYQLGIMLRDLGRHVSLADTTAAMTTLADVMLVQILQRIQEEVGKKWGVPIDSRGQPQKLLMVALGKLGSRELNLSSDVDLMFVFPEPGNGDAGSGCDPLPFFCRVIQQFINLVATRTEAGFVFRVDLRLRPFGDQGALVSSIDALLDYYQEQGRGWERYAMLKHRIIAGNAAPVQKLVQGLRAFVYRRYLDFGAIDSLRDIKLRMQRETRRRDLADDIKLGDGGIREVEFIVQALQLIHGGRNRLLQRSHFQHLLPLMNEAGLLSQQRIDALGAGYEFLRHLEHRLQAVNDEQTHRLPADDLSGQRLAWSMGFADATQLLHALAGHRQRITGIFNELVQPQEAPQQVAGFQWYRKFWEQLERPLSHLTRESVKVFMQLDDEETVINELRRLRAQRTSTVRQEVGRHRLDALMPHLLAQVAKRDNVDETLSRLLRIVYATLRRTAYLALLVENPEVLQQLVRLAGKSAWVADLLARHPILLDELLDTKALYTLPSATICRDDLNRLLLGVADDDLEQQAEQLCYFKNAMMLRIAACELTDVATVGQISDALTWLAEVILAHALEMAWKHTVERHGHPQCDEDAVAEEGFGIIAYGKLGGIELGWSSDLDLVFLHDLPVQGKTDREPPSSNVQFLTRLGQRLAHLLTLRTVNGQLYELDMRLRPSGSAGVLVVSLSAFADYQHADAWTWEHQALVRARFVVGGARVRSGFGRLRERLLSRTRPMQSLREEVVSMRQRLHDELGGGDRFARGDTALFQRRHLNLRLGFGAMLDIEFMAQFIVLAWGARHRRLLMYTDVLRILRTAAATRIVSRADAGLLTDAYLAQRAEIHRCVQQKLPLHTELPELIEQANRVAGIWQQLMHPVAPGTADQALPRQAQDPQQT